MRDPKGIAMHLTAWAREECEAQEQTLKVLEAQERAVRSRDLQAVEAASDEVRALGPRGMARARRRDQLLGHLAKAWEVPREALTLGSVVERLGDDAKELSQLRQELRDSSSKVLRASRRVGVLVREFRRVSGEVVEMLLTGDGSAPLHEGGSLIDAEV